MTVPGVECPDKSDPATIAKMTVQTLDRCLPPAMPGVTFLSGAPNPNPHPNPPNPDPNPNHPNHPNPNPNINPTTGGISEEDSSIYLNEINKLDRKGAFALTFSYSRALQSSCIKIWGGKEENYKAAQDQLKARAQANSEASKGEYVPGSQPSIEESLFVKNYAY